MQNLTDFRKTVEIGVDPRLKLIATLNSDNCIMFVLFSPYLYFTKHQGHVHFDGNGERAGSAAYIKQLQGEA